MPAVLVQIDGYDPVAGGAVSLRAASVDDDRVCHLDAQTWWPVIADLPTLRYDLFDGSFSGAIGTPGSTVELSIEPWPSFARYALADARVRIWTAEAGTAWGAWTLRFDGRATEQPKIANGRAALPIAVDDRWLDAPLLATYAGTGTTEGDAAQKGQPKPLALGAPRFVPPQMVNSTDNVFQVSAYGVIEDIEIAFERVVRFGASVGDYANYAALVGAAVPAGKWATCKALGLARHGAPPVGRLAYHVKGDKGGPDGWVRLPGAVIKRIALLAGGVGRIDDTSLAALSVARPWQISVHQREQTSARELIQRIAASVNAVAGVDWLGNLFVAPIGIGAATVTLDASGASLPPVAAVEQVEAAVPFWRLSIGAVRTWDVHALSDISFSAVLADRGLYDAAETYREGHIVDLANGSRWLYINATPGSGHAPPAGSTSDAWWDQIKPPMTGSDIGVANGATKNIFYRQATDPALSFAIEENEVWIDTSASPNVVKVRKGGAWQASASLGADLATGLFLANGQVAKEKLLNDQVLLNTDGTLSFWNGTGWISLGAATLSQLTGSISLADPRITDKVLSTNASNKNTQFSDYPTATGLSTNWLNNENCTAANVSRVAGKSTPYSMRIVAAAATETSCYQLAGSSTVSACNSDQYLLVSVDIALETGVLTGVGFQVQFYSSAFAFVGGQDILFNTALDTSGAAPGAGIAGREYSFRKLLKAPPGAFFYYIYARTAYSGFGSIAAARTIVWRKVEVAPATDTDIKAYGVEAGADVTANAQIVVIPPDDVVINANSAGTVLGGQLPMVLAAPTVTKGGVSVRAENTTTYALADVSSSLGTVTVDNTNGSTDKGRVTLPSTGFTGSGAFDLVVTVGGVAQPALHITVAKRDAAPARPAGGKTGETVIGEGINGTTYVQVGSIMNVTKAAGETIRGALGAHYQWEATTNSSRNAVVKFQTSPAGAGTWTDMGAGVSGTSSDWFQSDFSGNPGSITVNQSAAPADGSYDVRVMASVSASGAGTLTFDGSIAYVTVGV